MDTYKIGNFFWPESVKNTPKNGLWTLLGLTTSGLVGFKKELGLKINKKILF
jgi:hypothetical protein